MTVLANLVLVPFFKTRRCGIKLKISEKRRIVLLLIRLNFFLYKRNGKNGKEKENKTQQTHQQQVTRFKS